jgi:hypothetical protein
MQLEPISKTRVGDTKMMRAWRRKSRGGDMGFASLLKCSGFTNDPTSLNTLEDRLPTPVVSRKLNVSPRLPPLVRNGLEPTRKWQGRIEYSKDFTHALITDDSAHKIFVDSDFSLNCLSHTKLETGTLQAVVTLGTPHFEDHKITLYYLFHDINDMDAFMECVAVEEQEHWRLLCENNRARRMVPDFSSMELFPSLSKIARPRRQRNITFRTAFPVATENLQKKPLADVEHNSLPIADEVMSELNTENDDASSTITDSSVPEILEESDDDVGNDFEFVHAPGLGAQPAWKDKLTIQ